MAKSIAKATSLTIGAAMRNENVTPSGTPACKNPMKSGTAEHEQNGVTMPRPAATAFPTPGLWLESIWRVRSGEMKVCTTPMTNTTPVSSSSTFGVS